MTTVDIIIVNMGAVAASNPTTSRSQNVKDPRNLHPGCIQLTVGPTSYGLRSEQYSQAYQEKY
ncbi:hypothetical protein DSO57_1032128 [Entomophthora muscae]|uniref:Uncharacterized protein n=1 Tax=Entomophthora muscae TaxID=34485 RepID=A0ACC2ULF8_9FUNG|nr:hypothetical protein DSO57_1032128 [Entomophthora muscae]